MAGHDGRDDAAFGHTAGSAVCEGAAGTPGERSGRRADLASGRRLHRRLGSVFHRYHAGAMATAPAGAARSHDEQPQLPVQRGHAAHRRRIPVDAVERYLFEVLPHPHEFSAGVVARGQRRGFHDGDASWNVLRAVLLGSDAGDVRRGRDEHALDGDHRPVRAAGEDRFAAQERLDAGRQYPADLGRVVSGAVLAVIKGCPALSELGCLAQLSRVHHGACLLLLT